MAETENTENGRKRRGPGRPSLAETGAAPAGAKITAYLSAEIHAALMDMADRLNKRPSVLLREFVEKGIAENNGWKVDWKVKE